MLAGVMADIELTLKTTQVVIVCAFVVLTIYFNYVLIRSSLDILFWATIASIPLIGLKNSTTFISSYLANQKCLQRNQVIMLSLFFAKVIIYDRNRAAIFFTLLIALYIVLEKTMRNSEISKFTKTVILVSICFVIIVAALNTILFELKFVTSTFNLKGLMSQTWIKYLNSKLIPNIENIASKLANNDLITTRLHKCGINLRDINYSYVKNLKLPEAYGIVICLANEYKNNILKIVSSSRPMVLNTLKRMIVFGESGILIFSKILTFSSTVYVMTKQSIQPMQVLDEFLYLIDNTGYLSHEFKEIVISLISYNFQKLLVTCLSTFLTFSLFSMNIVAIPTILSAMTILIPGAPTYLIPSIGVMELFFLQKPYWHIIIFVFACNRIKKYCDSLIKLKVSLINRIYGGASITLGMSTFGLKGIFIGPILAAIPVVFWKMMKRHQSTGVIRKRKNE